MFKKGRMQQSRTMISDTILWSGDVKIIEI